MQNQPEGSEDDTHCQWSDLPDNVLLRAFSHLCLEDLCAAGQVCWHWHAIMGSDSLWSRLLQLQFSRSTPLSTSNSCRDCMQQLKTAGLWAAGLFKAYTVTVTRDSSTMTQAGDPIRVSSTGLHPLWCSQAMLAAGCCLDAVSVPHFNRGCLPDSWVPVSVAAGANYLVLLGCDGRVCDTRGVFTPQADRWAAGSSSMGTSLQGGAGHNPALLNQSHQLPRLQEGTQALDFHSPWVAPVGAVIKSVASGKTTTYICWSHDMTKIAALHLCSHCGGTKVASCLP